MLKRVIVVAAVSCLAAGCGTVDAAVHGYRRFTLPTGSMEPTIHRGQVVDARPVGSDGYVPRRGDIVVFSAPPGWAETNDGHALYLKRVVAIAGDRIGCCADGHLTRNGAPLSEPYLAPNTEEAAFGPVTVPAGRLWLMGDNRPMSADSRMHVHDPDRGTVPVSAVSGVVVLNQR